MTRKLVNAILESRARALAKRFAPHLPKQGRILDYGCGTGHTALALASHYAREVCEVDIVNMKLVGPAPLLLNSPSLPFPDRAFSCTLLLFVLHYLENPVGVLRELRRVTADRMIVIQSTYHGFAGRLLLGLRETIQGRGALRAVQTFGLLRACSCSLMPLRFYTRDELRDAFARAGWLEVNRKAPDSWRHPAPRDLFVLEPCGE
jgi:SAM-dependent methyltransferase